MNLRDLEYLVAMAEHKHFGKAALACHVTQPTLSAQLKKLEEFLEVELIERDSRRVWLTAIGAELAQRAQRILREVEQFKVMAKAANDPLVGDIRLGAFPTLAPYYLPQVLPFLRKSLPRLRCFLIEDKTPVLIQQLLRGEIDVALLALPIVQDSLDVISVLKEPFLLAVSEKNPLARRKSIEPDQLSGVSLLLLDEGHCLRDQALSFCQQAGASESALFRASSLETLRQMVAADLGATFIPAMATGVKGDGVHYIPFKAQGPEREIGLVFRRSDARHILFRRMAALFRRQNMSVDSAIGPKPD